MMLRELLIALGLLAQPAPMATPGYISGRRSEPPVSPALPPDPEREIRIKAREVAMATGLGAAGVEPLTAIGIAHYRRQQHLGATFAAMRQSARELAAGWSREAIQVGGTRRPAHTSLSREKMPRRRRQFLVALPGGRDNTGPEVA